MERDRPRMLFGGGQDWGFSPFMSDMSSRTRPSERKKYVFQVRCLDGKAKEITAHESDLESYKSFEKAIAQKLDINVGKEDVDIIIGYNGDVLSEENFELYAFNEKDAFVVCCYYRDNEPKNEYNFDDDDEDVESNAEDDDDEIMGEGSNEDQAASSNASDENSPEQIFYRVLRKIVTTITKEDDDNDNDNGAAAAAAEVRPLPEIPPSFVQQLQVIGIPEVKARNALLMSRMNLDRAAEYAFTHNDPEDDVPITPERYWSIVGRPRMDYRSRFGLPSREAYHLVLDALRKTRFFMPDMRPRGVCENLNPEGLVRLEPFWEALSEDPEFVNAVREERDVRNDFRMFLEDPRRFVVASPTTIARLSPILERHGNLILSI